MSMSELADLVQVLSGARHLVVFLHDNPDPDAMAAGWLLARIGESVGAATRVVYGGSLGRAENRAMARVLDIPLSPLGEADLPAGKDTVYGLVDTQPGSGNNSFPDERLAADIVIDHHAPRPGLQARFLDIRLDEGCSTTLVLQHFEALGLELDAALATAALYAIVSETQDLGREATRADNAAYLKLVEKAQLTSLGRIRHPTRDRDYYRTVARALSQVTVGRNTCICHIGPVPYPEVVAEMADFLVAMQQISWCLVSGLREGEMTLSIRTTNIKDGQPELVMKKVLGRSGRGGGHGAMAGGSAPCEDPARYEVLCERFTERFLEQLQRRQPERLRPLLAPDDGEP
jgi:nanoRNase/pAp phosphatase (c-di-AMP/oligoRNAs hydrolase)